MVSLHSVGGVQKQICFYAGLIIVFSIFSHSSFAQGKQQSEGSEAREKRIKFIYSDEGDTTSIWVKKMGVDLIYEGDIIVHELPDSLIKLLLAQKAVGVKRFLRWSTGVIPYKIQSGHPFAATIRAAIDEIERKTKVCFYEVDGGDYVSIEYDPSFGCNSTLGDPPFGFDAKIRLGTGCGSKGTILHELLHTIGLIHEHNRGDRDKYVKVIWENIQEDKVSQFYIRDWAYAKDIHSYDCGSIMHYRATEFGKVEGSVKKTTIENKACDVTYGQRDSLSAGDIRAINAMYYWATGCPQPLDNNVLNSFWHIEAKHSGKVLTLTGSGNNDNIVQKRLASNSRYQKFKFVQAGDNYYYIQNVHTNKVLTLTGDPVNWKCNLGGAFIPNNVVLYEKRNSDNLCLQDAQKWKLIHLGNQNYQIVSKIVVYHKSFYLEVKDGSSEENANIRTWHEGDKNHQKFILKPVPPEPVCDSEFVRQTVPRTLDFPGILEVAFTFRNTGTATWTSQYKLTPVFQGFIPTKSTSLDRQVRPGEEFTFKFSGKFASQGIFKFGWRLEANLPCQGKFGQMTPLVEVTVGGNVQCSALVSQISYKKKEITTWQEMLKNAGSGQKSETLANIDRVRSELAALENLARQKGC